MVALTSDLDKMHDILVQDGSGNWCYRVKAVELDVEIGAVEIKDHDSSLRADVKSDGTDNALITYQNAKGWDLSESDDSVLVYANTVKDGSGTDYVPLIDSDGHFQIDVLSAPTITVTATDLDVRDLTLSNDQVYTKPLEYTKAIAYNGDNPEYIGTAAIGSSKGDTVWQIMKITWSGSNPTDIQWAGGDKAFDKEWDERASYAYS